MQVLPWWARRHGRPALRLSITGLAPLSRQVPSFKLARRTQTSSAESARSRGSRKKSPPPPFHFLVHLPTLNGLGLCTRPRACLPELVPEKDPPLAVAPEICYSRQAHEGDVGRGWMMGPGPPGAPNALTICLPCSQSGGKGWRTRTRSEERRMAGPPFSNQYHGGDDMPVTPGALFFSGPFLVLTPPPPPPTSSPVLSIRTPLSSPEHGGERLALDLPL